MVVDFCAGAGGKTLLLGALMRSQGRLYAFDVVDKRLANLKPRLARSGLSNVHPQLIAHRARREGQAPRRQDRPRAGRRAVHRLRHAAAQSRPQVAADRRPGLAELVAKQRAILAAAATLVKPGGRLVYATCSVLPEENEAIVDAFLAAHPGFAPGDAAAELARAGIALDTGPTLKLLPAPPRLRRLLRRGARTRATVSARVPRVMRHPAAASGRTRIPLDFRMSPRSTSAASRPRSRRRWAGSSSPSSPPASSPAGCSIAACGSSPRPRPSWSGWAWAASTACCCRSPRSSCCSSPHAVFAALAPAVLPRDRAAADRRAGRHPPPRLRAARGCSARRRGCPRPSGRSRSRSGGWCCSTSSACCPRSRAELDGARDSDRQQARHRCSRSCTGTLAVVADGRR